LLPTSQLDIDPTEKILAADSPYKLLVDCRTPAELLSELGHVATSFNVNSADIFAAEDPLSVFPEEFRKADKDTQILIICRSGARAGRVQALLGELGYTKVGNMLGGMLAWNKANLPTVHISAEAKGTEEVSKLSANDVRDMILACFVDASAQYAPATEDKTPTELVREAFMEEAKTWEDPPRESFPAVMRKLGEIAKRHGHPAEAIAAHTSEFGSLVQRWSQA
jgi:rhodanese-related sulfurtransferase